MPFIGQHVKRVHVTGGPGSGKTTLARGVARVLDAPLYELDAILLEAGDNIAQVTLGQRPPHLAAQEAWVSDGVYFGWAAPFLESAHLIVCLDTPWRVAGYRILMRHIRAELSRNNPFPGWGRLSRFLRWSYRYYHEGNPDSLDALGVPETRSVRMRALEQYRDKLVTCYTTSDTARLLRDLRASRGDLDAN